MNSWKDPRLFMALLLIGLFAAAYFKEDQPDEIMKGAMIAAFSSAYAYWLGSSRGSAEKSEILSKD
jgi:hypothetical protein